MDYGAADGGGAGNGASNNKATYNGIADNRSLESHPLRVVS